MYTDQGLTRFRSSTKQKQKNFFIRSQATIHHTNQPIYCTYCNYQARLKNQSLDYWNQTHSSDQVWIEWSIFDPRVKKQAVSVRLIWSSTGLYLLNSVREERESYCIFASFKFKINFSNFLSFSASHLSYSKDCRTAVNLYSTYSKILYVLETVLISLNSNWIHSSSLPLTSLLETRSWSGSSSSRLGVIFIQLHLLYPSSSLRVFFFHFTLPT